MLCTYVYLYVYIYIYMYVYKLVCVIKVCVVCVDTQLYRLVWVIKKGI